MKPAYYLTASVLLLAGCTEKLTPEETEYVSSMSTCEKVTALVDAHSNGFQRIKGNKLNTTKYMDSWDARFHLVGKDCQVWRWSNNKHIYTCSITSPDEEVALQRYEKAKVAVAGCLNTDWQLSERPRHNKPGFVAVYESANSETVVATQAFAVDGLFKGEWTNYFFVGDKKRLQGN